MHAVVPPPSTDDFPTRRIRRDFPTISPDNVYLDSVASSLTPLPVIEAMTDYYMKYRANVHRGSYDLSLQASEQFEAALANVARFIGARILISAPSCTASTPEIRTTWGGLRTFTSSP